MSADDATEPCEDAGREPEWRQFEDAVVQEHRRLYGHEIWHTSMIPECELYEAGIFNDYNKLRLDRIRRRREMNGQVFKYVDYGVDFLAKETTADGEAVYHIGQAKHYRSRKVSANDLGTFLIMRLCVPTQSYLYTSGPLEVRLQEIIEANPQHIAHHRLPFGAPEAAETAADAVAPATDEATMERRAYQIAAAEACAGPGRKILEMACGTGKTIVAGDILAACGKQRIVCVAPLLISVHNLYDRLQPFLKDHRHVIVDSEGTTDKADVKAYFETEAPIVIYTTFKSAEAVIAPFLKETDYLLVDEVHNAVQRDDLCELFRRCSDALFLSATIPETLNEVLDATTAYRYSISDAIRDGFICDYEVILPSLDDGHVDVTVPDEWRGELDDADAADVYNSMAAKALFLATGMLQYGNRRCIVYLTTRDECDVFMKWIRKVMEEYQGASVWCGKIDASVGATARKALLNTFESDDRYDKYVLTSVRILDEAVDIPRCDSEFITSVSDQISEIRTVQRLSRGGRLDPTQPFKKNRLFMWTDDWNSACGMLSLLREMDPAFNVKVRSACADYTRTVARVAKVEAESKELMRYVTMRCMTLDERFMAQVKNWCEQRARVGRALKQQSSDPEERRCAIFQGHMRGAYKKNKLTAERIRILNSTPGWEWEKEDPFPNNVARWSEVRARLGKQLYEESSDPEERRCARFQAQMRKYYKQQKLSAERILILESTPGWEWEAEDPFPNNVARWSEVRARLGKPLNEKSLDPEEKRSGQFQADMRKYYKKNKLSAERISILNSTPGWEWEKEDPFPNNVARWSEVRARLRKPLNQNSSDPEERRCALFQSQMRTFYKQHKLSAERIEILNSTPGWKWFR